METFDPSETSLITCQSTERHISRRIKHLRNAGRTSDLAPCVFFRKIKMFARFAEPL